MDAEAVPKRAEVFSYAGLDAGDDHLVAHYELDGEPFEERVTFTGVSGVDRPAPRAVAELWYALAGLSYYKAGAAREIDASGARLGAAGRALLASALVDGLAEFSFRNDLPGDDVAIGPSATPARAVADLAATRVLVPFGGGIDSVVSVSSLSPRLDTALFVVSPPSGPFAALEATAAVTGLSIVRATRTLDAKVLARDPRRFSGHVPVTAMIALLAAVAAVADGRGGVVMSNERSASVANLSWHGREVNHQWSKSWAAEQLLSEALAEVLDADLTVASALRDASELLVAQRFAQLSDYHAVFRSCNRAFTQEPSARAANWCGECDKCLFIALVLSPFVARADLAAILGAEPLVDPARDAQLRTLVGLGELHKPFECVGDPDESAAALVRTATLPDWRAEPRLRGLAAGLPAPDFDGLLIREGPTGVPAHWLR